MKNPATFLERHDTLLLMFCSALFGLAWGLGHERGLIPNPWWFTPSLQRFCLILMGWTALLYSDPIQRLFWSIPDFVALTLPFFAGMVFVPQMALPALIDYWVLLGKVSAAAVFGIAITQAIYSLLPGWRARMEKRTTTPAASENVEVAPDLSNVTVANTAEPSSLRVAKCNGLLAAAMNVLINIENPVLVLVTRIGALRLKLAAGHPVKEVDRQRQTISQRALPARNRQPVKNAASASGMNASDTNIQHLPIEARLSRGAARGPLLSCS